MVSVQEATMDDIPLQDEMGSVEYRLLMVYAQRTRSASKFQHINQEGAQAEADGEHTIATNGNDHKRHKSSKGTKKKSKWLKRMTPKCLKPENDKKKKRKSLAASK
ncbi:Hypothetical predicted protein [Pelobates cultripes]|uniref:Uncharacterized protein n=1 Tax=Pelobates cultripes TaxID=61616 RepID=A0AAD1RQC5_PELCU|nr:Hypothetical predicted protein [Pelobates cultripes]